MAWRTETRASQEHIIARVSKQMSQYRTGNTGEHQWFCLSRRSQVSPKIVHLDYPSWYLQDQSIPKISIWFWTQIYWWACVKLSLMHSLLIWRVVNLGERCFRDQSTHVFAYAISHMMVQWLRRKYAVGPHRVLPAWNRYNYSPYVSNNSWKVTLKYVPYDL